MLESDYSRQYSLLVEHLKPSVMIPDGWKDYFHRQGVLPMVTEEGRRFTRRYWRGEAICEISQSLPAIARRHEYSKVYLKDLSRNGLAFLVAMQVFPGEDLFLWTERCKLACSAVRCIKHNDHCYEVGATIG